MEGETALRLGVFFGIFAVMALWEGVAPKRARMLTRAQRWLTNWGISVVNSVVTVLMKSLLGAAAVVASLDAADLGIGLFNQLGWPIWLEVLIAFVILDFAIWFQHLLSHKIPILWRLHRVHHADRDVDVTTAIRFHPIEILLSMAYKLACVLLIGPAAIAVFLFEVILNASAMFNHSNVKLPLGFDRVLRTLIVTPDMHRVHHSIIQRETDSNYGFFLSTWDKLFRTYIAQPELGHDGVVIGLEEHQSDQPSSLLWSLLLPFKGPASHAALKAQTEQT